MVARGRVGGASGAQSRSGSRCRGPPGGHLLRAPCTGGASFSRLQRVSPITEFGHSRVRRLHGNARYSSGAALPHRHKAPCARLLCNDILRGCSCTCHAAARARRRTRPIGKIRLQAWPMASPRSPGGMLGAWGASAVEDRTRSRVRGLGAHRLARAQRMNRHALVRRCPPG